MRTDSKSAKSQSSHHVFLALLGSAHVKAACKMLVKLTQELNFIKILPTAFTHADPKSAKDNDGFTEFLHFGDLHT